MRESNKTADSRREAFLDTAEELFTEFGYENASIERLISRLGVSKGAFYHYFRSKSDLLDAMIDRILDTPIVPFLPMFFANFKQIVVVTRLPKTRSGKILRTALRRLAAS